MVRAQTQVIPECAQVIQVAPYQSDVIHVSMAERGGMYGSQIAYGGNVTLALGDNISIVPATVLKTKIDSMGAGAKAVSVPTAACVNKLIDQIQQLQSTVGTLEEENRALLANLPEDLLKTPAFQQFKETIIKEAADAIKTRNLSQRGADSGSQASEH